MKVKDKKVIYIEEIDKYKWIVIATVCDGEHQYRLAKYLPFDPETADDLIPPYNVDEKMIESAKALIEHEREKAAK